MVFGMPKEAIERGAVDVVLPLPRIAAGILSGFPPRRERVRQKAGGSQCPTGLSNPGWFCGSAPSKAGSVRQV